MTKQVKASFALASILFATLVQPVSAERFELREEWGYYACINESQLRGLINAAAIPNYFESWSQVFIFKSTTCPMYSIENAVLNSRTIIERGTLDPTTGYSEYVLFTWEDTNGGIHYSAVVKWIFNGIWYDFTASLIEGRLTKDFIDFITN
jgi:hypothetical protein